MKHSFSNFFALLILSTALCPIHNAFAGPPFVIDDPEPVDYQHWEFYLATVYDHSQGGSDSASLPFFEMNYGIIPDVHLHLATPSAYSHEKGSKGHYGYGDTEIGAKYRFIHETDDIPQVGIFPQLNFPTGNEKRGLGNGKAQVFLPLWFQKSFGEWKTFGGGGWWYNPGEGNKNFTRVGGVLQREINQTLTLGTEVFHETKDSRDGESHTAFNVGGYINLSEKYHLLMSFGRDIDGPNQFSCYIGLQLVE